MMDMTTMASLVTDLKELKSERDMLDKTIESYENAIKEEMKAQDKYEFSGEGWKVTWNMVSSNKFSQSEFKVAHPDLFEQFKRLSESRRFNLY